jgi:hypothetical protein
MAIDFPSTGLIANITTYSYDNKSWVWNGYAWDPLFTPTDIIPLDDISNYFDGMTSRFVPRYQGEQLVITNPLRLHISINGIIQYVDYPDYVWQSPLPRRGFQVDSDGYMAFSEVVSLGSEFDGIVRPGSVTSTKTRAYPFKPMDILLGG